MWPEPRPSKRGGRSEDAGADSINIPMQALWAIERLMGDDARQVATVAAASDWKVLKGLYSQGGRTLLDLLREGEVPAEPLHPLY